MPSKEGHQSIHQGALRLQGQTSLQDSDSTCHQEVEGGFELNFQMFRTTTTNAGMRMRECESSYDVLLQRRLTTYYVLRRCTTTALRTQHHSHI